MHSTREMQSGRELRETIQVFTILIVSKIRLRPSWAVELGALGRRLLRSVSDGDKPAAGSVATAQCLVLISVLEDDRPQEQWALSEFAGGDVTAWGHPGALPGFGRRGP